MSPAVAERVAVLELERAQPTPWLPKPLPNPPYTPQQQARHRAELLAALRAAA